MTIEKVSKIIWVHCSYAKGTNSSSRKVLMSLPRVRWLERDGESALPSPPPPAETVEEKAFPFYAFYPIYPREQSAYDLYKAGRTIPEIAEQMSLSVRAVRTYITYTKKKMEYQAAQKKKA